jgi:ferredoxin
MKTLKVFGKASQKIYPLPQPSAEELNLSLLDFLRKNKIPIASSCNGVGQCLKCRVTSHLSVPAKDHFSIDDENVLLSCQVSVDEFIRRFNGIIYVTYL